jgi:hypothetical protein
MAKEEKNPEIKEEKGVKSLAEEKAGQEIKLSRDVTIIGTGESKHFKKGIKRTVTKFLADQLVAKGAVKIV